MTQVALHTNVSDSYPLWDESDVSKARCAKAALDVYGAPAITLAERAYEIFFNGVHTIEIAADATSEALLKVMDKVRIFALVYIPFNLRKIGKVLLDKNLTREAKNYKLANHTSELYHNSLASAWGVLAWLGELDGTFGLFSVLIGIGCLLRVGELANLNGELKEIRSMKEKLKDISHSKIENPLEKLTDEELHQFFYVKRSKIDILRKQAEWILFHDGRKEKIYTFLNERLALKESQNNMQKTATILSMVAGVIAFSTRFIPWGGETRSILGVAYTLRFTSIAIWFHVMKVEAQTKARGIEKPDHKKDVPLEELRVSKATQPSPGMVSTPLLLAKSLMSLAFVA